MKTTKHTQLLMHLAEFEKLLANYTPSTKTIATLARVPLVLLVGPTASGRNTLINLLVQTDRYYYIVSNTTRKPRKNNGVMEQQGVEYWFKTEEEFLADLKAGKFLEAAIIHKQQVSGINIAQLESAAEQGKIAVNEVENVGAAHIYAYKPDTLFIFLLPPDFPTWMERLRGRGDMDEAEVCRRLQSAKEEISLALGEDYYQFVVNYEIHEAAAAVDEIANGRALNPKKQAIGRNHAEQLLVEVQQYLSKQ